MQQTTLAGSEPIVLAYSGGLDTSFLVPWLKQNHQRPIITVTVDTGGIDAAAAAMLRERALALGAIEHHQIDARADYFEQVLRFLIMGNVRRGQLYPLCVGAERVMQAQTIARMARKLGTQMIAHGCTAAGNDQVRFEVALRTLAPELEVLAPVRDHAFKRSDELQFLQDRKLPVPPFGAAYSTNRGLWGVTIGGTETLTSSGSIPENAWVLSRNAFSEPRSPERHTIGFERGRPVALDGASMSAVELIERLEPLAAAFGIGRGIHLGDTIIGTKGRVAFEAPAAETLLSAHRELEKLVMTARQQRIKESVAQPYGDLVHEGQLLDPVCRDIEALMVSSQERVTGDVHVLLRPGNLFIEGVDSPHSLMAASKGVYGEAAGEWTATDALGFSKIVALSGMFYRRAGADGAQGSQSCKPSLSTRLPRSLRRSNSIMNCACPVTFPPRKAS
jgi:argininosuccinate synthase